MLPWHTRLRLNSSRVVPLKCPALATTSSSASSLNDLALLRPLLRQLQPKWLQMTPACLPGTAASPKRCFFQPHASSHLAVNKRSLIHQIPHLLLPTLQSDAVIFTSTPFCVMLGFLFPFFLFLFSYLFRILLVFWAYSLLNQTYTIPTQMHKVDWYCNWFEAAFKSAIYGQRFSFKTLKRMQKKKHCLYSTAISSVSMLPS